MQHNGDIYKYIAVYVDDLAIPAINAKKFVNDLCNKNRFKIKGDGPLDYHLGMQSQIQTSEKYVNKIIKNYEKKFGEPPKEYSSPLCKNDHLEIDETLELTDEKQIQLYMFLIGELQWLVTIGRLDIHTAVMTMSRF